MRNNGDECVNSLMADSFVEYERVFSIRDVSFDADAVDKSHNGR